MHNRAGAQAYSPTIKTALFVVLAGVLLQGCGTGAKNDVDPAPTITGAATIAANPSPAAVVSDLTKAAGSGTKRHVEEVEFAPGESMTFEQLVSKVEAAMTEYTWPAAYVWDTRSQYALFSQEDKEAGYQQGYEYSALSQANSCAWTMAWADARRSGDSAGEAEALAAMTDILPNNPNNSLSSSTYQWLTDMAAKASLGDPTMVTQYISANCTGIIWQQTP